MQKTKRFDTRKAETWVLIDRLGLIFPVLIFLYLFFGSSGLAVMQQVSSIEGNPLAPVAVLVIVLSATILLSIPIELLWFAVCRTIRKAALSKVTFPVSEGIDYYREKFVDLTPADISLLMDLEIEPQKDISALMLRYAQAGLVVFEGDRIRVTGKDHPLLQRSDKILLNAIALNTLNSESIRTWSEAAFDECMQKGLLEDRAKPKEGKSSGKGCGLGCLIPAVLLVAVGVLMRPLVEDGPFDSLYAFLDAAPIGLSPGEQLAYLASDPVMLPLIGLVFFVSIVMFAAAAVPGTVFVKKIVSVLTTTRIIRSQRGEMLAEQLAGMKNFIHDFSSLPQAEKEALIVWDDYLTYAVVLEENTDIVHDILSMKNISDAAVFSPMASQAGDAISVNTLTAERTRQEMERMVAEAFPKHQG